MGLLHWCFRFGLFNPFLFDFLKLLLHGTCWVVKDGCWEHRETFALKDFVYFPMLAPDVQHK